MRPEFACPYVSKHGFYISQKKELNQGVKILNTSYKALMQNRLKPFLLQNGKLT